MHMSSLLSVLLLPVGFALAADYTVLIGESGGLTFNPTFLSAVTGDTIIFQFTAGNNSVTQSTFATPCEKMTTPKMGIDSEYQFVAPGAATNPQWSFTLDAEAAKGPMWFYCKQGAHCSANGMVFAINPTAEKTFPAFQSAATGPKAKPYNSGLQLSAGIGGVLLAGVLGFASTLI